MLKFYYHFAAAYGTIWFFLLLAALITQSNISTGNFGLIGFPIISILYAIFATRFAGERKRSEQDHAAKLNELENKITQLQADMIVKNAGSSPIQ